MISWSEDYSGGFLGPCKELCLSLCHYLSNMSPDWMLDNIGFLFLYVCDYTDYCLPALWEVCGLVGIRSAAL